jgi:AMIN domain-containing protein
MQSLKFLCGGCAFAFFALSAAAQNTHQASVRSVSLTSQNPLQLRIQTSEAVAPRTQMVANPERLVIDISNAIPGAGLHGMAINRGEVKGVRVSLFSTAPPVTRIVVDLKEPQWYRIVPDASGLLVSLGTDPESAGNAQPAIGWVSAKVSTKSDRDQRSPFVVKRSAAKLALASSANGASVQFANGLLTIHANGATLSEVLFQIQKQTGAEIAIPSGTEQDRVAANFGPGPASEVLGELLNGTGLNFVVVGSEADPKALRSVILTHNAGNQQTAPAGFVRSYVPAPVIENIEPQNQDNPPFPDNDGPPPQAPLPQPPPPTDAPPPPNQ